MKKSGRNAFDVYQEMAGRPDPRGPSLKDTLTKIVRRREFQALPHGPATVESTRESALMDVVVKFRRGAWQRMLFENSDLREAVFKERRAVAAAASEGMKSLKATADKARLNSVGRLLNSYGIGAGNLTAQ